MKIDTQTNRLTYKGRLVKVKTSGIKTILIQNKTKKGGMRPGTATQQLTSLLNFGVPGHHVSHYLLNHRPHPCPASTI